MLLLMVRNSRYMSKIFGVSLGRNATQSLTDFLMKHGLTVTHFYQYNSVPLGTFSEDIKGILDHFESIPETDAYIDIPNCFIFEELYYKYPDAKFINITRPKNDWIASMKRINNAMGHDGDPYIFEEAYCNMYQKTDKKKIQDLTEEELGFIYDKHLDKVRSFFTDKANSYLELEINDIEINKKINIFINKDSDHEFLKIDRVLNPEQKTTSFNDTCLWE